jgi:hypothetical protein
MLVDMSGSGCNLTPVIHLQVPVQPLSVRHVTNKDEHTVSFEILLLAGDEVPDFYTFQLLLSVKRSDG